MNHPDQFAVIVIGAGHAGVEAALASARMRNPTLLITHNIDTIGQMSCNPAIGGIGKGHIVKEIDALGGIMARAADEAGIHFRTLNARKGAAVQATRAQADRALYKTAIRRACENQPNLTIFQQPVQDLIIQNGEIHGVTTQLGIKFHARAVILTAGTFLRGKIHIGDQNTQAGRAGDPPSIALADRLRELPLPTARLKTGTPPRIDGKTIDYTHLTPQPGETPPPRFSFLPPGDPEAPHPPQIPCHITQTNPRVHDIIRAALPQSPIYGETGAINSPGPRYCPSIEDKIVRFADRDHHQIFIEPEGLTTREIYPNGISTSLPFAVQLQFVRAIQGFHNAVITRPGYAIEYDYFDPRDLHPSLQSKHIPGLFLAGQINGTTGYEEAAGQGIIAGINAARHATDQAPWTPARHQAYIGVMIDDLVTRGTTEPYRMFTSRAEYRLQLREDNADTRLTETAHRLGLISPTRWQTYTRKRDAIAAERTRLQNIWIPAQTPTQILPQPLQRDTNLYDLLRRPELTYPDILRLAQHVAPNTPPTPLTDPQAIRQLENEALYSGYITRQQAEITRLNTRHNTKLPPTTDYTTVRGLSTEACQKLTQIKPQTLGQAARIPGITPATLSLLIVHLKKHQTAA